VSRIPDTPSAGSARGLKLELELLAVGPIGTNLLSGRMNLY
jgi:hypothetical protein